MDLRCLTGHAGSVTDSCSRRLVELSHRIFDGMTTYPGLPGPEITDHLSRRDSIGRYGPGTTFQIGRISMVANTGTYLDVPFHRFAEGDDLAQVPIDRLVDLPGILIGVGSRQIGVDLLRPYEVGGCAVLFHSGWDTHFGTTQYGDPASPFLSGPAAKWLVDHRAVLVGIDSVNIDDMADPNRPAHTALLAAGIPIVEHLTHLDLLPEKGFRFSAAPPLVSGMGTFPVRAFAIVG
jgi:arylformamidase